MMPIKDCILSREEMGPVVPISPVHEWIFQALSDNLRAKGDKEWLIDGTTGEREYFRDIIPKSTALASAMKKLGFKKGDTVMLYCRNNVRYFYPVLAALLCGGRATMAEPASLADQVADKVNDSKTMLIFVDGSTVVRAREVQEKCSSVQAVVNFDHGLLLDNLLLDDGLDCPDNLKLDIYNDVAYLPYSSGTTGLPKGIVHTHWSVSNILSRQYLELDETCMFSTPMFHLSGFMLSLCAIVNFNTIAFLQAYTHKGFVEALEKIRPVQVFCAPLALNELLANPLSVANRNLGNLRQVKTGGGPFTTESKKKLLEILPNLDGVGIFYGMTEIGVATETPSELLRDTAHPHSGSLGIIAPGVELKIINPQGEPLGPNCSGEVCMRSGSNMIGYLNKEDETKQTILDGGWVRTGDCGYYTEDGYVYYTERMKELIKYKGFHVVPAMLENILVKHQAVKEAAVVGAPHPVEGEHPCAFVVLKEGEAATVEELADFVNKRVCEFERLRGGVRIVEKFTYVGLGKVSREELRKTLRLAN